MSAVQQKSIRFSARSLLSFVLSPTAPLEAWLGELDEWLARSPNFFAAKPVMLDMSGLAIELTAYRDLLGEIGRRGIRVMAVESAPGELAAPDLPPIVSGGRLANPTALIDPPEQAVKKADSPPKATSLIVEANVRTGQTIFFPDGDLTIIGRVASGAEVAAGGSLHVYGALHGRAIAGVGGCADARIFCNNLAAELLCIGGAYVTAEEMDPQVEGQRIEARRSGAEIDIAIRN